MMKIAMFSNTYLPHVGGVARAVDTMANECRRRGHDVRIITPEASDAIESEYVLRVPAIQHFNGSDFSVQLPAPNRIRSFIQEFQPDLIHSHHPFLLGDAALREAWKAHVPVLFTHHTLYERYTHYVPLDSQAMKRVAIQLATQYCNLCDQIIAPSESIAKLLVSRGVKTPVAVIPTGIDTALFGRGDGRRFRRALGIAGDAMVLGHAGRLAKEKNLGFLAEAARQVLMQSPRNVLLIIGDGPQRAALTECLGDQIDPGRIHMAGQQSGDNLAAAYAAMDCFIFASQSETQGLVVAEAMAAGKPVIALDGPGVREMVRHGVNGFLLPSDASPAQFAAAVSRLIEDPALLQHCAVGARSTAGAFSVSHCVDALVDCYGYLLGRPTRAGAPDPRTWDRVLARIEIEWELMVEKMSAAAAAMAETPGMEEVHLD